MPNTRRRIHYTVLSIIAIMVLFLSLFLNKINSPRIFDAIELRQNGIVLLEPARLVKPFSLIDHNSKAFTKDNLENKISLVFFGFTHCPDICPSTLADLARVMAVTDEETREQLQIILVSLDPARDTPEILKPYVEYFNPNFIGVTGNFLALSSLANSVNVAFQKVITDDSYVIDHSANIVVFNSRGDYQGFIKPPLTRLKSRGLLESLVRLSQIPDDTQ